jgi:hypothetical protein
MRCRKTFWLALTVLASVVAGMLGVGTATRGDDGIAVTVINASEPTLCAETDNVYVKLVSPSVRRFSVEASHPAYGRTIVVDHSAPDFRSCNTSNDPAFKAEPRQLTIAENAQWRLAGIVYPSFWRAPTVPVRVGDRVEQGIHLLQLWKKLPDSTAEVLVLYPPDGYWRARPLPPKHLGWSAYGSSFLLGPIETAGRPFVDIREVVFDPSAPAFHLTFARGGSATVRLDALDLERIAVGVTLQPAIGDDRPFAALRSMFVTEINADVARLGWRGNAATQWQDAPIMSFRQAEAVEVWAGRTVPSHHNLSAPDMRFGDFRAMP